MSRIFVGESGTSTSGGQYGRITNRIITRGLGPHRNRLVTQGYGGPPPFVVVAFQRSVYLGRSAHKRELPDEIIVWAKLVQVNSQPPPVKVQGFIKVPVKQGQVRVMTEHVSSRIRKAWEDFKVIVKRLT